MLNLAKLSFFRHIYGGGAQPKSHNDKVEGVVWIHTKNDAVIMNNPFLMELCHPIDYLATIDWLLLIS